ncbi:MAG: response regulator transcription factor [Burkholderiales bacterium]|nr:response regulator transcription factor [Nitrosomonas sp.]MCP5273695.1 response regulator transcription factor [Burkholderiales bacterium]
MLDVLIVEDINATATWMKMLLKKAFPDVRTISCQSIAEAKACLSKQTLALAIVDLNLPDGSGLNLIPVIRQQNTETRIVVMTVFDDNEHIFSAIKAGAIGYLLKDQSEELLINKLHGVMKGDPPLSPLIARKILEQVRGEPDSNQGNNSGSMYFNLSKREEDILVMISKGLNRNEIAEIKSLSPHTIARYIKDIYQKLDVNSRAEAAIMAYRIGLIKNT